MSKIVELRGKVELTNREILIRALNRLKQSDPRIEIKDYYTDYFGNRLSCDFAVHNRENAKSFGLEWNGKMFVVKVDDMNPWGKEGAEKLCQAYSTEAVLDSLSEQGWLGATVVNSSDGKIIIEADLSF